MKKSSMFFTQLFLNATRFSVLLLIAALFVLVGVVWVEACLYIGYVLLGIYGILCVGSTLLLHMVTARLSDEDSEFGEMMEKLTADPDAFLAEITGNYDELKQLHGEALLTLSDEDLYEAVYFQNLDMIEDAEDEELERFSGARRTVYILSTFDTEIQNGGLCQFFVNSSKAVAPYVSDGLQAVNATAHRELFDNFIAANGIDVCDLGSFQARNHRGYMKQTKRYDFDAFDDAYYDLPPLQDAIVAYIKDHIAEF